MEKKETLNKNLKITLDVQEVAALVGETCIECYGVVGLTSGDSLRNKLVILKRDNYVDGVFVSKEKNKFYLDVHLVCAYEVKISEIVTEVNKRLTYILSKKYGELFTRVNVYVDEIREL